MGLYRALLLFISFTVFLSHSVGMSGVAAAPEPSKFQKGLSAEGHRHLKYETVTGFFLQDDPNTDPTTFNYSAVNLGLINRSYPTDDECVKYGEEKTQWERFACYIDHLNEKAADNVQYKLLIMGRHGEGYHNVAEAFYGTPAWDCYWSMLDGNGTLTWADAHLTPLGKQQALVANSFWSDALATKGIPAPQSYYTSPLYRCLQTARLTFKGLDLPENRPFKPEIKELLREAIGIHTCDRRSNRTFIHSKFPSFPIEPGFTEQDLLWKPKLRETTTEQVLRLTKLLDDVFSHDSNTFISFTSHSGSIGAILTAIGHRDFALNTGAVIPALVKAEWTRAPPPSTSIQYSTTAPTCTSNPTATPTSI